MTRTEFFDKLVAGAKWDVGVSIARTNPLPLDANSVFESVEALEAYVKTNALAYPGQLVSVIGETELSAYHITSVGENGVYTKLAASSASGDVAGDIATLQTQVGALISDIDALEAVIGADASEGLRKAIADNAQAITDLSDKIGEVPTDTTVVQLIEDSKYDDADVKASIAANSTLIASIQGDYLNSSDKTELEGKITANANAITALTDGVDPEKIDGVKELVDWVDSHGTEVVEIKEDIQANTSAIAEEKGRAETAEGALGARLTTLENYDHAADIQTAKDYADKQITALGIDDYAKTSEVEAKISAVQGSTEATIESVETSVENLTTRIDSIIATGGEPNTINTIKVNDIVQPISSDKAVNINVPTALSDLAGYADLNNKVDSLAGIKSVDTAEFIIDENGNLSVGAIAQTKVTGLTEALTAAGKIDEIVIDGTALAVVDKKVALPVATMTALGLVKGTENENGIAINDDGTMSVNSLNVNKLTQTSGEFITLSGGNAAGFQA